MTLTQVTKNLGLEYQEVETFLLNTLRFSRVLPDTEDVAGFTVYMHKDFEYREGPVSVFDTAMEVHRLFIRGKEYWEGRWAA